MRILIEGQSYLVKDLKQIFDTPMFYTQKGDSAIINSVGYYYSQEKKQVIYMLPKVFMSSENSGDSDTHCLWDKKNTIFKKPGGEDYLTLEELFKLDKLQGSLKHESKYEWIRHITISFYNSLIEFKKRNRKTTILNSGGSNDLNTNLGDNEYSYLDLVLSFINFYKKNKSIILLKHIEQISSQAKKAKWERTIRKTNPLIGKSGSPIYLEIRNKKTIVNLSEELLVYFFSILNHYKEENNLYISIDKSYNLIKGEAFKNLQKNGLGLSKLRKIKYKYFSDTMKRMYRLCELYFDPTVSGSIRKQNEEFISFTKYNIVFEDMVDKLLTEETALDAYDKKIGKKELSIKKLKNNDDGKIIDHLFEYESLIDTSNIFYIGDSKYYKPGNIVDKLSIYKQFTYAKNIIQYNINLFNSSPKVYKSNKLKYRDNFTEGYNITPNFLLYGIIHDHEDFKNDHLETLFDNRKESIKHSYHWKTRLFDRDSLFISQYKINYLFVLNAYTELSQASLIKYRNLTKDKFRNDFIKYFEDKEHSNFTFYKLTLPNLKEFVISNFKILNGKCFSLNSTNLLIAIHEKDKEEAEKHGEESLKEFLENKKLIDFSKNSKDIFNFPKKKAQEFSTHESNDVYSIAAEEQSLYSKEKKK